MKKHSHQDISEDILDGIIKMKKLGVLKDTDTYSDSVVIALPIYETKRFSYSYNKGEHIWTYKPTNKLLCYYNIPTRRIVVSPTYPTMSIKEKNAIAFIIKQLAIDYGVHIGDFYTRVIDIKNINSIIMGEL